MPIELRRSERLLIAELPPRDSVCRTEASVEASNSDDAFGGGIVLVVCASAFSGAVMGFLLAGAFKLSAAVFLAGILGTVAGWWASKLSQFKS